MTVKLDKYSAEYSQKRRNLLKEKNRKGGLSHDSKFK